MSNVTIFKQGAIATTGVRELSELAKTLTTASTSRRIQTNTNGTFKRVVNGEQIGNAVRGEINLIITHALPKVSRVFYADDYDANNPSLPNCWSNLGDKPEAAASDPQHSNCADCPQNITGSGKQGGRACRFQRRISALVEGDASGDIYQFNVPAKSLFGKGTGNVHPFESYIKYLLANGESPDNVVTNVSYDLNADSMELQFTPLRNVSDEEYALVREAQSRPEAKNYCVITVAHADKVAKLPAPAKEVAAKPAPKIERSDEPEEEEEVAAPVKRESKSKEDAPAKGSKKLADVVSEWGNT